MEPAKRRSVEFSKPVRLRGSPRDLHYSFGHLSQRVDFEDSFRLSEETVQQSEVATCDADDLRDLLLVQWASRDHSGNSVR